MSLPKIQLPIFELTLPSNSKKIKFKPFTVKEEKLLLIASESEDTESKIRAVRQIVNNCCLNLETDVEMMPSFDLEYCFVKIRAKSVGNEVELRYRDNTDEKIYDFLVDLDKLEVTFTENHTRNIPLSESVGVIMRYPTIEILSELSTENGVLKMVQKCIETIYDENSAYQASEYSLDELNEFIESISASQFEKVLEFFSTMPALKHELHYTDSAGTEKTITLQGIDDFFP
jgi:hypothetical protein